MSSTAGGAGDAATIVASGGGEVLQRSETREIGILAAREEITVLHARCAPGEWVARPHVHHEHTDAFYVLEGLLIFELGREAETITIAAGGFVAAPPEVVHSFGTGGDRPAFWLTIHADDGGFAAFMRGIRDGVRVEWDFSAPPGDGGLSAREAIVSPSPGAERLESSPRRCLLRCALPDLYVVEWQLDGRYPELPPRGRESRVDSFFVLEGELEVTLAETTQLVGPGGLISVPRDVPHTLDARGRARILSLHAPGRGVAKHLGRLAG